MKLFPVTVQGISFPSVRAAALHFNQHYGNVSRRLRSGWTIEQALGLDSRARKQPLRGKKIVTSAGTFSSITEAALHFKIQSGTIQARIQDGWTHNEAVGLVPHERKPKQTKPVHCQGKSYANRWEFAKSFGLNEKLVAKRLHSGWTPEQAVELVEPPPRFRNQVGGARTRHWKNIEIVDDVAYPSASEGEFKVYVIRNKFDGKEYVGITITSLAQRLKGHKVNARKMVKGKLYNAMRRYGEENFTIELMRNDARSFHELQQQEIEEIKKRNTLNDGYNTSPGGSIGTPDEISIAGIIYPSHSAAAIHFGIDPSVFNLRVGRLKWTPEQAAEIESRQKFTRRKVVVQGKYFKSLKSAANHFGIDYKLAHNRIVDKGWSLEQALELALPPDTIKFRGEVVKAFGVSYDSLNECARHFGIKPESLRNRISKYGQDIEDAINHFLAKSAKGIGK